SSSFVQQRRRAIYVVATVSATLVHAGVLLASGDTDPKLKNANCLLAGSCMSDNVHVRLREKGSRQKWPCYTSLSSLMGYALSFLGEYDNMILMRCRALHLTFIRLPSLGACYRYFCAINPFSRRLVVGGPVELSEKGILVWAEKGPYSVPHNVLLSALPDNIYIHKLDHEIGRIQQEYEILIVQRIRSVLLRTSRNNISIKELTKGTSGTRSLLDAVQLENTLGRAGVRSPQGVIPPPIRPDERSMELHPYSPGPCTLLSPGGLRFLRTYENNLKLEGPGISGSQNRKRALEVTVAGIIFSLELTKSISSNGTKSGHIGSTSNAPPLEYAHLGKRACKFPHRGALFLGN
nr:maturase, mitochondrial [Tanacetum cinerariifolium]